MVIVALGVAAAGSLRAPEPRPLSTAPGEFAAARALGHLNVIAADPRPVGSIASAEVRAYLEQELADLGLAPTVLTRVVTRWSSAEGPRIGTVANIPARMAGQAPTGRVLLVAHYDSVPTGPGAADNGANVAAILEVMRALRAGSPLRNDVDVLFTDAEEVGLLGAQAFVDSGRAGDPSRVVVVNLDARGVSGPAVMFQSVGGGDPEAVRAAGAFTTSLADDLFRMLPNDTDLTVFARAGMRGLNFAFIGGAGHYHTPRDDLDHLSAGSVQDMGDAGLAAVRQLGAADLAAGPGRPATAFSVLGRVVTYPAALTVPLAAIGAAAYLVLLLRSGPRTGLSRRQVTRAAATLTVPLVAAALIGLSAWWVLRRVRPDLALAWGFAHLVEVYAVGEALLVGVVLVGWYRWIRRSVSGLATTVAVLGWFAGLALLTAVLVPGGAYLFTWPTLTGVGAAYLVRHRVGPDPRWWLTVCAAMAVPAVVLLVPLVVLLVPLFGLSGTAIPLALSALLGAALIGNLIPKPAGRSVSVAVVVLALAGSTTLAAASVDRPGLTDPRPVSLAYLLEDDPATANWLSFGASGVPVVQDKLTGGSVRLDDRLPPLRGDILLSGPAALTPDPVMPEATGSVTTDDGIRRLRARLYAPAGTHRLFVYVDTSHARVLDATIDGVAFAGGTNQPAPITRWEWGFSYTGPPRAGVDLTLRTRGPVRLRLVAVRAGLPSGVSAPALPPEVTWSAWPDVAGQTYAVRTQAF
jgi:hypothetical protein